MSNVLTGKRVLVQAYHLNFWPWLPKNVAGVEWYVPFMQLNFLDCIRVPGNTVVLHLGDLRGGPVGDLSLKLADRVTLLQDFLDKHTHVEKVVVHSESALGWGKGNKLARREFWQLLQQVKGAEVVIENSIVHNPKPRYDYMRFPKQLASELRPYGLRLTLDVGHALVFVKLPQVIELLSDKNSVGHMHLGDWAPSNNRNGLQSQPLGTGVLPIREILQCYQGSTLTLEVGWGKVKTIRSTRYLANGRL